ARVEDRVRILEDELQATAVGAHFARGERREIRILEPDFAGRRLDQLQHRTPDRALARTRFADEAQHLALGDLEADVVDGAHRAVAVAEIFLEIAYCQHRRAHRQIPAGIYNRRPRESGDPVAFVRKTLDSRFRGNDGIPK